ncbi:protein rapunzel-like [Amblyraja radiata]|uniref:protein rapunzel-like n=1 Tax=Amblyraja radiata TaxID=386614 RepID=UPI001403F862|nr:protein rapunzel-like [Amblyraja radiata]XP_032896393.1 protein rapunzel-like [Amblyraja radiata]
MAETAELLSASAQLTENMAKATVAMGLLQDVAKFAATAGVLSGIFQVGGAILKLVLGMQDSEELKYMKKQFQIVSNKLDVISDQIGQVLREIQSSTIDNQYFTIEENLKNQFRKYMDILSSAPEFRDKERDEFLAHFDATKGDQNLHTLFDAVMGFSAVFGRPILETAMSYDQRNRRLMEVMCCRLKELFCIGLIALLGHAAVTGNDVEALKKEWNQKLADVEAKMKSMVDQCVSEFPQQAEIDVERMVKDKGGRDNNGCATFILEGLVKKYDWVRWSVRVYDPISGFENHCVGGPNSFYFFRLNNVNVVVSYAIDPRPIDEAQIRQIMQGKDGWWDAREVFEFISTNVPGNYMVHAVRRYKGLWNHDNFPDNCHFWENYSGVTLCVHST